MGQERQGAAVGLPALLERLGGDEHRGDETAAQQVDAHDDGGRGQELARVPHPAGQLLFGGGALGGHQRHHADTRFEAGQAQDQQREGHQRRSDDATEPAAGGGECGGPVGQGTRLRDGVVYSDADNHRVHQQEHRHQRDGDGDGLGEAQQEHPAQDQEQHHRDGHRLTLQERRQVRVFQQVDGGIRGRQRDGDDPGCGDKAEQDQDKNLAPPERQEAFEHRHRALPVRAFLGHAPVHRQHAQQRQGHDQEGGQRRQGTRGERGDARQVGQGGKVVHAGQAHDLPPALLRRMVFRRLGAHRLVDPVFQQPPDERVAGCGNTFGVGHAGGDGKLG